MRKLLAIHLLLITLSACMTRHTENRKDQFHKIDATVETEAVKSADDAADDPAIWVNAADPSQSLLICSNKKSGIVVYDLHGNEVGNYPVGLINNIDVRQGIFLTENVQIDIAAGSNRSDNTITVMQILPDGSLADVTAGKIQSKFTEVYGFCLYHDLQNKAVYAIVNNKEGYVEQWLLQPDESLKLSARLVRTFKAGESQLEGCVCDDELGYLYIGEEDKGIWKFMAHPDSTATGKLVDEISANAALKDDIEGLTIYYGAEGKGYLIASSQGNNSFAVYQRENPNGYIGTFKIADGPVIDGVSETDGIDVTAHSLGEAFPSGLFVAQDGHNTDGEIPVNQNFKLVKWEKIAQAMKLN